MTETTGDKVEGAVAERPPAAVEEDATPTKDPIARITRIVLVVCAVVFVWYVLADRFTPMTNLARVQGLTVPVVPQVSGYLTEVNVRLHSTVSGGDLLFQVDPRRFDLDLQSAEARLQKATQQVGAQGATVESAVARVGVARAQLDRAQRNYDRTEQVLRENPGALSQADWDRTETSLAQATEKVASAEADLEKAREQLGTEGPDNPDIQSAVAALEQAHLNREFSSIRAPSRGFIESFNVDVGHYAQAGQPLATFVSTHDVWIQADLRENNLGRVDPGDPVEFTLDVAPGRVFRGTVRSLGYGVSGTDGVNPGELPTISSAQGWLRDPQRFPVIISLDEGEGGSFLRVGGQASVVVYAERRPILNAIAWARMRLTSLLSYVR